MNADNSYFNFSSSPSSEAKDIGRIIVLVNNTNTTGYDNSNNDNYNSTTIITMNAEEKSIHKKNNKEYVSIDKLIPDELLVDSILTFVDEKSLLNFSISSKKLRSLIFSSTARFLWDFLHPKPFSICIDGYCPTCRFSSNNLLCSNSISNSNSNSNGHSNSNIYGGTTAVTTTNSYNYGNGSNSGYGNAWSGHSNIPVDLHNENYNNNSNLTSKRKKNFKSAIRFLSSCPLKKIKIHCFVTDIPVCLAALASTETLEYLDLSLTNKSYSPPLEELLMDPLLSTLPSDSFINLKELILNSNHLQHINRSGRAKLLDILGKSLLRLSFKFLSPSKAFSILENRCPLLTFIRIDKAQTTSDLIQYHNNNLLELELRRCNFTPTTLLNFNNLQTLGYSAMFRMEATQVITLIKAVPNTLTNLYLELPSSLIILAIQEIANRLPLLVNLTIDGAYDSGVITIEALRTLGVNCPNLKFLSIKSTKSVNRITFNSGETFLQMTTLFPSLEALKIMFEDDSFLSLNQLLSSNSRIKYISFYLCKKWMNPQKLAAIESMLKLFKSIFPAVTIATENVHS